MTKPVLVLDFDDTLTAMPGFWRQAIPLYKSCGGRVICMTQRTETDENIIEIDEWIADNDMPINVMHFTNGRSKLDYIAGMAIDKFILCDDNPKRAVNGV